MTIKSTQKNSIICMDDKELGLKHNPCYVHAILFMILALCGVVVQITCFFIKFNDTSAIGILEIGSRKIDIPDLLADIHVISTSSTNQKLARLLDKWTNHPLINTKKFKVSIIAQNSDEIESTFPVILTECSDYLCKISESMKLFYQENTKANWFFQVTDSNWVDLQNLATYISRLHAIYDPTRHIVFKSQSIAYENYHIIGDTSGWLMSRAFISKQFMNESNILSKLHSENNTESATMIETKFVRSIFPSSSLWDDNHIIDMSCENCLADLIDNEKWEEFPECTSFQKHGNVKDIVSVTVNSPSDQNAALISAIVNAPQYLHFVASNDRKKMSLCYSKIPVPAFSYSSSELRLRKHIIQLDDYQKQNT